MNSTQKRRDQLKVGLFLAAGLGLILMTIILLGGDRMLLKTKYPLSLHLNNSQGLARGSVVSLSGLPVGNIRSLEISPATKGVQLSLDIDVTYQDQITDQTVASVRTQGALGDKYIFLTLAEGGAVLKPGSVISVDESPGLLDMMTGGGKGMSGLNDTMAIVKELRLLISSLNAEDRTGRLMESLNSATIEVKNLAKEARMTLNEVRGKDQKNLELTMTRIQAILKKIDEGEGTLGALINDPSLHQKLTSFLGESPRKSFMGSVLRQSLQSEEK